HARRVDARRGLHVADRRLGGVPLGGPRHGERLVRHRREQGMSATVTSPASGPTANGPTTTPTPVKNVSFGRVLHSEWIKLWTLRSTWWTLAATVLLMVGIALGFALIVQLLGSQMEGASP